MKKITLDVEQDLISKIEKDADNNLRSVSAQIRYIIKEYYKK